MKKIAFSFLLLAGIFLTACSQKGAKDLILGKWQIVNVDFSKTEGYSEATAEQKLGFEMVVSAFRKVSFEFFKDNTFNAQAPDLGEMKNINGTGSYELINDGKYIEMKEKDKETVRYEITLCTEDSLKLQSKEGLVLIFSSSKK